jgi:hypothetical protein
MLWEVRPAPEWWSGSLSPTDKDSFVICIKHNEQHFCKVNLTTRVHKGGKTKWPTRLDAGRSGTDASLAHAIDHTGVPLATWTSIVGAVAS